MDHWLPVLIILLSFFAFLGYREYKRATKISEPLVPIPETAEPVITVLSDVMMPLTLEPAVEQTASGPGVFLELEKVEPAFGLRDLILTEPERQILAVLLFSKVNGAKGMSARAVAKRIEWPVRRTGVILRNMARKNLAVCCGGKGLTGRKRRLAERFSA